MSLKFAGTSDRCYRNDNDADGTALDFSSSVEWTISMFARFTDLGATQNCALISKFCTSGTFSGSTQALWRVTNGGAPTSIHVYKPGQIINTEFSEEDVWYLISCSCDGSSGITLYIFEMDGTAAIDGETDTAGSDDSNLTAPIELGSWNEGAKDPMIGDLAFCCYSESKWSRDQTLSYLRNPHRFASLGDTAFFLPLLGTNASSEPDWSGNGRNFTRAGCTTGDNPPVASLGFDLGWRGITAVAGATKSITAGIDCTSQCAATIGRIREITANITCTSTTDASIGRVRPIAAGIDSVSTCESTQQRIREITAGIDAASTTEAAIGRILEIVAGVDASATVTADQQRLREITVGVSGVATVTALPEVLSSVKQIIAGISAVSSCTASVSGVFAIESSITGTSTVTAPATKPGTFRTGVSDVFTVPAGGKTFTVEGGGKTFTV